ncbi:MAG: hypothetical protein EA370_07665 [Wenzhouxiangella sp.]|nr:MAG: hypothetical protein EA370_07665 [Wenzhouxiangella sp.]
MVGFTVRQQHCLRTSPLTRWVVSVVALISLFSSSSLWAQSSGDDALVFPRLGCLTDVDNRFVQGTAFNVTPRQVNVPVGDWNPLAITAHLGYLNQNPGPHFIPRGSRNFFTPGTALRNQPTEFFPGLHVPVFSETFFPPDDDQWEFIWFLGVTALRMRNDPDDYCAASATLQTPMMAQPGQSTTLDISGYLLRPDHQVWLSGLQGEVQAEVLVYHPRGVRASAELPASASGLWSVELRLPENNSPLIAGAFSISSEPRQVNATLRTPAGTVLAGTESEGLFRKPAGSAWQQLDIPQTETRILSMAGPASGERLFVGTDGEGLFISTDDGFAWQALTSLPATRVNTLQLLDGEGLALLAGTENGLFMTSNAGQSWQSALPEQP